MSDFYSILRYESRSQLPKYQHAMSGLKTWGAPDLCM